jgi:hypothetical protein
MTPADKDMGKLAGADRVSSGLSGDPNGARRPAWPRYDPAAVRIQQFINADVLANTDPLKPGWSPGNGSGAKATDVSLLGPKPVPVRPRPIPK